MQFIHLLILAIIICFAIGIYPNWQNNIAFYATLVSTFALILYLLIFHKIEIIEHLQVSGEAIQNVGSIYNTQQMKVDNLEVSGTLTSHKQANFNNLSTGQFNLLPRGVIVAWNGQSAPAGWALCDGQNGTPDLRNRFVVGWGSKAIGNAGGAESTTLQVGHLPPHNHSFGVGGGGRGRGNMGTTEGWMCNPGNCAYTAITTNTGNGSPFSIMPPFYTLAYIMKL